MKVHNNAQKLVDWLAKHQLATVAQVAATGMMNLREASDAIQYLLRHGVLERVKRPGACQSERVQYRLTGIALPVLKVAPAAPSFDGLLAAWGIARIPPCLQARTSHKLELTD